jgi:hypothetical protein
MARARSRTRLGPAGERLLRRHAATALGALALLMAVPAAAQDVPAPLPWQEPAPTARMFLQLPLEPPEVSSNPTHRELRLIYSNSILWADTPALRVAIHVETAAQTVEARSLVAPGIEAQLAIPVLVDTGGFLDGTIVAVEGLFSAVNTDRSHMPAGVARFQILRRDGTGINARAGAGIGDAWVALKIALLEQRGWLPALALRPALKLPTGQPPYGSGELDLGGGAMLGWIWRRFALRMQLDVLQPTGDLAVVHLRTHTYGAFQLATSLRVSRGLAVHLQFSGHAEPITGTGLPQFDANTYYVTAGVTARVGPVTIHAGAVENVFSPYRGADITFLGGIELDR